MLFFYNNILFFANFGTICNARLLLFVSAKALSSSLSPSFFKRFHPFINFNLSEVDMHYAIMQTVNFYIFGEEETFAIQLQGPTPSYVLLEIIKTQIF